jgi:hypothetical protein
MAYDPTDSQHLRPDQRLDEVAALLATGMRRLLALGAKESPHSPQIPQNSRQNGLDEWAQQSVHVSRPVNESEDRRRS